MARDRSIVLRLKAEISDFQAKMGQASRSLSDFEKSQQQLGGAATTTLGRMVQSAKINEREWTQVGRTMLGVGTAMAGMGVAALKTGVEYNSLRQKATQGLTAVTGSTEKAAAQMRRLDEYGRGSWLMRDTLIRAQTQMTGFGIETGKVIPYMSALADAVAATGGSNQDFEELARVMGQVQSQGKITARELMQFGIRGVDAAQLIGDSMGKTAGQIRSEITAGTLDAGAALDALADGMGTRFAGASDLVRETFTGTMDNLKAAWRDLSAAFASPLVDPEGGGLLVGWVNGIASSFGTLQGIVESMPSWMKTGTLALGTLSTAATLAGGAFMVALPQYARFQESLQTLANTHPGLNKASGAISAVGKFAARAAIGVAAANAAFATLSTLMVDTPAAINEMAVALRTGELDRGFEHLANGYNTFGDALRTLTSENLFDKFDRGFQSIIGILPGVTTAVKGSEEQFATFGAILSDLANSGDMDEMSRQFNSMADDAAKFGVSSEELLNLMPGFRDELIGIADAAGLSTSDTTLLAIAMGELDPTLASVSEEALTLEERLERLTDVQRATLDAGTALAESLRSARDSFIDWSAALGDGTFVLSDFLDGIEAQNRALLDWDANMQTLRDRGAPQALLDQLTDMGVGGAEAVAALATASEKDFQRAGDAADEARDLLAGIGVEYDGLSAKDPIEIIVETDDAILKVNTLTGEIEDITATMGLDADDAPARTLFEQLVGDVAATSTPTILDLDPRPAEGVFSQVTTGWDRASTHTNLDLNKRPAEGVFSQVTSGWERTSTNTNLGLNTGGAQSTLDAWKSRNSSFTVWANVQTRGGANPGSMLGKYHGGKITAPGLNAGGKVPGPRAAYDNVLWPLSSGGRTLTQPLSGGEWVINSAMSQRYDRELASMNAGTYPSGGSVSVSLSDADVARIAAAVREGASVGTRAGFGDLASRARLSGAVV